MNLVRTTHLSEEQFADCAMGLEATAEVATHLSACNDCREELAGFAVSMESFNQASMAWSESRPLSARGVGAARRLWGRPILAAASWAMAACLLLGLGFSLAVRHEEGVRQAGLPVNVAANMSHGGAAGQDTEAQIAEDNQLLLAVDVAIRSRERSPVEEYALERIAKSRERTQGGLKER